MEIISKFPWEDVVKEKGGRAIPQGIYRPKSKPLAIDCARGFVFYTAACHLEKMWCPHCRIEREKEHSARRFKTAHEHAQKNGGKCLTKDGTFIKSNDKVPFECANGHRFETLYGNIEKGYWCKVCGRARAGKKYRTNPKVYIQYAKKRGGTFLGLLDDSVSYMGRMKCSEGHIWKLNLNAMLSQSTWCPKCANEDRVKYTYEVVRKAAERMHGKLLSKEITGAQNYHEFECKKGHCFQSTPSGVVNNQKWCPYCAGTRTHINQLRDLGPEQGWTLLSTKYVSELTPYQWLCAHKHKIERKYAQIKNHGFICHDCRKGVPGIIEFEQLCREKEFLIVKDYILNGEVAIYCTTHARSWSSNFKDLLNLKSCCF